MLALIAAAALTATPSPQVYGCATHPDAIELEVSNRYQALLVPVQITTRSWSIHADFVTCDGRLVGATPLGVRERGWTRPGMYRRLLVPVTVDQGAQVQDFLTHQMGKPYNFGIFTAYLRAPTSLPGTWACVQLVQAAFRSAGLDLTGHAPEHSAARDILRSPLAKPMGEGETP